MAEDILPRTQRIHIGAPSEPLTDLTLQPMAQGQSRDYGMDYDNAPAREPSMGIWESSFKWDNMIVATTSRKDAGLSFHDDGTDPIEDNKQFPQYAAMPERFVDVFNKEALTRRRAQIDQELEIRAVQERYPWLSAGASMVASTLSPTTLVPALAIAKIGKGAYLLGRAGMTVGTGTAFAGVGASVAAAVAAEEAILQSQQQLRTWEESAAAIGGSFVLGGLLGVGGATLARAFSQPATRSALATVDAMIATNGTAGAASVATPAMVDMVTRLKSAERVTTQEIEAATKTAMFEARAGRDLSDPDVIARVQFIDQLSTEIQRAARVSLTSELEGVVRNSFGSDGARLLDQGGVKVVQSVEDLPARPDGVPHFNDTKGMFDGNKAYIVADNVAGEDLRGVLLHEIGVHYGMQKMLGDVQFKQLLDDVTARAQAGEAAFAAAKAAVPKETPPQHMAEEVLAYLVENAPEAGIVQRVIAAVKQFIRQVTGGAYSNLSEAEIRQLAVSSLRKWNPEARPSEIRYARAKRSAEVQRSLPDLVAAAKEMASWNDWYERYQVDLKRLFGSDTALVQKMLSVTSQSTGVQGNVTLALKAYRQYLAGEPFEGYLGAVRMNLERIRNEEAIRGQKIAEYGKANEGDADGIAVDRHIAELLFDHKLPTAAQVAAAKSVIRQIAGELGWDAKGVQAALWAYNIVRKGGTPQSYDTFLRAKEAEIQALRTRYGRGEGEGIPDGGPVGGATGGAGAAAEDAGRVSGIAGEAPDVRYSRGKKSVESLVAADNGKDAEVAPMARLVDDSRIPTITPHDLIGETIFATIADQTAAGAVYKGIDGSELKTKIAMLGGPGFPTMEGNVQAGVAWANRGKGITTSKAERAKAGQLMAIAMGSRDMHQSNTTVARAVFQTVEAYVRDGRISPENVAKVDEIIRERLSSGEVQVEGFPGLETGRVVEEWFDKLPFDKRSRFVEVLGVPAIQDLGGPSLPKILDATRDPTTDGMRWGDVSLIVRLDPNKPMIRLGTEGTMEHPDYPNGVRGTIVGRFKTPINYQELWSPWMEEQGSKFPNASKRQYAFGRVKPTVTITKEMADRLAETQTKSIQTARQARLAVDFGADRWRVSGKTKTTGGISPQEFVNAIKESPASATLTPYTASEVTKAVKAGKMRVFQLGDDGRVWFALKKGDPASGYENVDAKAMGFKDNEVTLTSVVNNEQGVRGIPGEAVMLKAIQEGATALDAYAVQSAKYPAGFLPTYYRRFGFEEVGRSKFDLSYFKDNPNGLKDLERFWSSTGWKKGDAYPDVVFMKWRGTDADRSSFTRRYLDGGAASLFEGRVSDNVAAARADILGDSGGRIDGQSDAVSSGDRGLQGDAGRVPLTATGTALAELKGLSDTALRNFGLTRADIDSLKYSRGGSRNERIAEQLEALSKALENIDNPDAFVAAMSSRGGSVGAEAVAEFSREDLQTYGKRANMVQDATWWLNPILRLRESPNPVAQRLGQMIWEDVIKSNMHMQGQTMGPQVETLIRQQLASVLGRAAQQYEAIYQEGVKSGMRITRNQFSENISAAMRRGDASEIPAVVKAAKMWRDVVFDPLKKMAQETRIANTDKYLLDPDIETKFAESYLHRMANHQKLIAGEFGFKNTVADWMEGAMRNEYTKSSAATRARLAALDQDKVDLQLDPEARLLELEGLEKAYEDLDVRFSREADIRRQDNALMAKAAELRRKGDRGGAKTALEEARAVRKSGGERYGEYLDAFKGLNRRQKNVDFGFAGMAERQDEIVGKMGDIHDANLRGLDRLVAKGQRLERDLARLDPQMRREKIEELRDQIQTVLEKTDKAAERLYNQVERAEKARARAALKVLEEKRAGGIKEVLAADTEAKFATETVKTPGKSRSPTERTIRPRGLPEYDGLNMVGLHYTETPEGFFISGSYLPAEMRNKGLGKAMYETLVAEAQRAGKPIFSDGDVSFDAARVYKSLQKKGAKVTDNTKYYDGMDKHYGKDGSAFRIDPPPLQSEKALEEQIRKYVAAEQKRSDKLGEIRRRIDRLDALDLDGQADELREAVNALVVQQSDMMIGRGDKVQRLKDKLARVDPAIVQKKLDQIEKDKQAITRKFYDRWEVQMGGEGVDINASVAQPRFKEWAKEYADQTFQNYSGRSKQAGTMPDFAIPLQKGPLQERTLPVPDTVLEPWLENDIGTIAAKYARSMLGQIEVTRKFGRPDMADQFKQFEDMYVRIREQINAAATPKDMMAVVEKQPSLRNAFEAWRRGDGEAKVTKERLFDWLTKREASDRTDLEAGLEMMLGKYANEENLSDFGSISRLLVQFNMLTKMGGYVIGSMTDVYRPAMVHGFKNYMQHGIRPLLSNLGVPSAVREELAQAGVGVEGWLRGYTTMNAGILDPYAPGSMVERMMEKMGRLGAKFSGMTWFNDFTRQVGGMESMTVILKAAMEKTNKDFLAVNGIDQGMAQRIADQFKVHGSTIKGVLVAGTDKWSDVEAARVLRAAISKDVSTIFTEKSVGDVPNFANRPLGRVIFQFRGFAFASNQRVLMRGLQDDHQQFVGALVGMTTIGMMVAYLRSLRGGEDRYEKFMKSAENPGFWIGEGLDNSGIFSLLFEASNTTEKLSQAAGTSINPVKNPLRAMFPNASQQGESTRFVRRDPLSAVLGPSASIPQDIGKAISGAMDGDFRGAQRLTPLLGTHPGISDMIKVLSGDSAFY
jgi:hypothetical protein